MGLFVHLYIDPEGISPSEWEATYRESLTLLRAFPAPLIRIAREEIGSSKRFAYVSDLVHDPDTRDECWWVVGDSVSGRRAEDFQLFRHKERQFGASSARYDSTRDVLWASTDSLGYINGNGVDLFGGKTQGHPYHLAILAVAILFETRFPEQCYLFGDIESVQAGHMCRWVHETLDTPLITPICLDGERLYRRIEALYEDSRHAIGRFQTLFAGSDTEEFESLLRYAERRAVLDVFMKELGRYSSLNQYGAIGLVSKFLSATRDLGELIGIVLNIAEQGKKTEDWNLEVLLGMLCRHYLTFPCEERKPLGVLDHPQDEMPTIDDALSQAFMIMAGRPTEIDVHREVSEVLETFCTIQPDKRAVFREIISSAEQAAREKLETIETLIREKEQNQHEDELKDPRREESAARLSRPIGDSGKKVLSRAEIYILKQVERQTEGFAEEEKSTRHMGGQLRRLMAEPSALFEARDREHYLRGIYDASAKNGFALQEAAWKVIDGEEDVEILKVLFALSLVDNREMNFWRWRIHIMESPSLWRHLVEERGLG
uniref:Uncharacterized protein n=1 Tax=Candidatus Kentrum sp. LPFa TaxID=2126335 RepID=A0A450X2F4_9GAMM|nr:MAG: hypothetical protein BECKLPF1236B_GA0070989_13611 [Candidatus Kentron sp. LPFa]